MKHLVLGFSILAVAVIAAAAFAAPDVDPWESVNTQKEFTRPTKFDQDVAFQKSVNVGFVDAGVLAINGVGLRPIAFACNLDFPSIPAGYPKKNPNPCAATGVTTGAACVVGVTAATPPDGGSAWYLGTVINALGRGTDVVEIDIFNLNGDGGAVDPPDASYRGYCFN